jgi:hypothetical protein
MSKKSTHKARHCCTEERHRLVQELRACDYCSTSYDEFQKCYVEAASVSGERSRSCATSAS